jgi:eukaryotic-like serine/threonine-protein kinase
VSGLFGIASGLTGATPAPPRRSGQEKRADVPLRYVPGGVIAAKYRLARLIGEGGMGAVWLARNMTLDADVAIKLIRREIAGKETSERLLHEARSAARIGHPSIVRIYDFGETEYKDPFIVMELLEGESLRAILDRKGKLAAVNAVQTLLPILSALVAAHTKA